MLRRVAAAVCAGTAVLLLVGVLRPPPPESVAVVVAARSLDAGARIERSDLDIVQAPVDRARAAGTTDPAAFVGRRLASRIEGGETLTASRLVPRTVIEGLESGTVAARVGVVDAGSLALVSPGRRVSLYSEVGGPALARDALVLAVDTPGTEPLTASPPGVQTVAHGLVVALPEAAAERIFAGQRPDGGVHLVVPVVTG